MRLLPVLLLAACASSSPQAGDTVTIQGTVVSVDASALPRDGDALVRVRTEAGERVVRLPSREARCSATELAPLEKLVPGARVLARGTINLDGDVTPCTEADHSLRLEDG